MAAAAAAAPLPFKSYCVYALPSDDMLQAMQRCQAELMAKFGEDRIALPKERLHCTVLYGPDCPEGTEEIANGDAAAAAHLLGGIELPLRVSKQVTVRTFHTFGPIGKTYYITATLQSESVHALHLQLARTTSNEHQRPNCVCKCDEWWMHVTLAKTQDASVAEEAVQFLLQNDSDVLLQREFVWSDVVLVGARSDQDLLSLI